MTTFQQQSRYRKALYWGLMVALLGTTLVYRNFVLAGQADRLELREQNVGETDVAGSVVRLTLTGSRGFTLTVLWYMAIEAQKRHEWNQLEVLVDSVIKLQPHFITPWLFQSWNLAYNVSVECDLVREKYYYISRGIQLLAEGERQNRNHPDLRFNMAYYYHEKFGMSDENHQLRSLFQLSCIDPLERDPARYRKPDGTINLTEFRQFCEKHPHLVRRLREVLGRRTPADVVDFLAEHRDIPSRYEDLPPGGPRPASSRLKPPEQQFPVLPRKADMAFSDFCAEERVDDDFCNYAAARVWFAHAQQDLPPPSPYPGPGIPDFDRTRYRIPRHMASLIFRGYPARAQSYLAERRQQEGWLDQPWEVDANKEVRWFADKVVIGDPRHGAGPAWHTALELWKAHGEKTGLQVEPKVLAAWRQQAEPLLRAFRLGPRDLAPRNISPEWQEAAEAQQRVVFFDRNREMTNFAHFYNQSKVEQTPEALEARRLFLAEQRRKAADTAAARQLFEEAFPKWKAIFLKYPDFQKDPEMQEEAYRIQHRYREILQDQHGTRLKQLLMVSDLLTQGAARPPGVVAFLPTMNLIRTGLVPAGIQGPFDDVNAEGEPLIGRTAIDRARFRLGLQEPPPVKREK